MSTLLRKPQDVEILVALTASQIHAANLSRQQGERGPGWIDHSIEVAVTAAEEIVRETYHRDYVEDAFEKTAERVDAPAVQDLDFGVISIDEFGSQRQDGTDKRAGISVEWRRSGELGKVGDTLSGDETRSLLELIVGAVTGWADVSGRDIEIVVATDDIDAD